MGLDYFPGYEYMIYVLAWIIYIFIPVGTIWGTRRLFPNPKAMLVAPFMALHFLFILRTVFVSISDEETGIQNIFIWPYQFIVSAIILLFYWLYANKEYLSKYIRILRLVNYVLSLCFGISVGIGYFAVFGLMLDGWDGIRAPHSTPAGYFVLSLIPLTYFLLTYGIRRIQPKALGAKNIIVCFVLAVLGCVLFVVPIFSETTTFRWKLVVLLFSFISNADLV